jgi:hypothetical protein
MVVSGEENMPDIEILNVLLNGGTALFVLYLYWLERLQCNAEREINAKKTAQIIEVLQQNERSRIEDYKFWLELQNEIITYSGARKMLPPMPVAPSVKSPQDKTP